MKTQLVYRDTGHIQNGFKTVITAGFAEFPLDAELPDEKKIISLTGFERNSANPELIATASLPLEVVDSWGHSENYQAYGIGDLVRQSIWNVPATRGSLQRFFRRTNVEPSQPGLVVMAFVGLTAFSPDDEIDEDNVFQFQSNGLVQVIEGRIGIEVKPDWGTAGFKEHMRGNAISALLRRCTWGFGDEPVGLMSEMALGINEKMDRFRDLKLADSISTDEWDEYHKLEKELQRHGLVSQYEQEEFVEFVKKRNERGLVFPSTHPVTRNQFMQSEEASTEIMREIMTSSFRP
ncbi:hypothetical protein [Mesorhizobium sp. SP-1A]|uniref:hypothetical protein n=1 Tax=Mesorhizobium sp. SP-1A TaxID=3077840 RepID=UPI0028F72629|nr:hypothetical protein [Mesorhizobium sp. SP-1A]